jgi:hypothetical protein
MMSKTFQCTHNQVGVGGMLTTPESIASEEKKVVGSTMIIEAEAIEEYD